MTQIQASNSEGKSRHSLLEAISKAVATTLKAYSGGPASVNVIVEGYEFDGEEYVAKVRVMVMPHELETDNLYHENDVERHDRQEEADAIATGFAAAAYDIGLFNSTHDKALQMLEAQIKEKIVMDGKVILIASDEVHDMLRKEAKEMTMQQDNKLELPSLDLGGHGGGQAGRDEAA